MLKHTWKRALGCFCERTKSGKRRVRACTTASDGDSQFDRALAMWNWYALVPGTPGNTPKVIFLFQKCKNEKSSSFPPPKVMSCTTSLTRRYPKLAIGTCISPSYPTRSWSWSPTLSLFFLIAFFFFFFFFLIFLFASYQQWSCFIKRALANPKTGKNKDTRKYTHTCACWRKRKSRVAFLERIDRVASPQTCYVCMYA